MKQIILLSFVLLLGASACNGPGPDDLVNCTFPQEELLSNYADEIIIPRFDELAAALLFMESSTQGFYANPTPGLLVEIQITFGLSYRAYQKCSPFAFGPGLINGISFRERMNTFPTDVSAIAQNISAGSSVASSEKSEVGLPAVGYLLFGEEGTTTAEIVTLFTTDANAANRRAYFQQLVAEMKTTVSSMVQQWSATGGNYREGFVSNTGMADGSSLSLLVNEMSFDFETLKNFKFKVPLGKLNGGVVLPSSVEAFYSGGSLELAILQLTAFRELYLGIGSNGADGVGLYEFLVCLETKSGGVLLADRITTQFEAIADKLDLVPNPLSQALVNDKQLVDNTYEQMQMMVPLLKFEMPTALGVQVTYQDNDGD
ncbi:MAG: imelysin family protein [Flavobacteriales bacterium]|nr:imelysin family protein [Flavobacteriales bacterium]